MWLLLSADSKSNSSPSFGSYTKSQLDLEVCYLIQNLNKISTSFHLNGKIYFYTILKVMLSSWATSLCISCIFLHVDSTLCQIQHANTEQFVGRYSTEGDVLPEDTGKPHILKSLTAVFTPGHTQRRKKNKPLQPAEYIHWKQVDCL